MENVLFLHIYLLFLHIGDIIKKKWRNDDEYIHAI